MTRARVSAAALFVAGVAAGSWLDPGARTAPERVGDYWVLAADFHVHGFLGDGALPPWEIRAEARRRGLDVVALTNHNQRLAGRIDRWLSGVRTDPLMLAAEEITSRHYHLIAIGITKTVGWDQPAIAAMDEVHAQGGAAIAAHPVRVFWEAYEAAALAALDGAEIAHPLILGSGQARSELVEFSRRARAHNPDLAAIASTDFHVRAPMGLFRTYVFAREFTAAGVVEAVHSGRTVAYDVQGNAYGDPSLLEVAERRWQAASAVLPEDPSWPEALSVATALLGLLGMILSGFADTSEGLTAGVASGHAWSSLLAMPAHRRPRCQHTHETKH
jgi:predicted metal-dependent phosphoesterase TrpH